MVERVRSTGIGGLPPTTGDRSKDVPGSFVIEGQIGPEVQTKKLDAPATLGVETLMALQAVGDALERDRAAHKRGNDVLDKLTDLELAMLADQDETQVLDSLGVLSRDVPEAANPRLASIIGEVIALARGELAKRDRFDLL